ncbi:MAG TPA: tRNA preQ1(34) S-adenosylmethionine ribosyltransferase-isomerase QueA [Gemmatimonadota bacterium]|nr:tRNA preQ1(34) S-adenosylmethionine ribosyltransferase-isomerase QueA [Gemmatimonadota bacterium]
MRMDDFDYDLPPGHIAQEPPAGREESRLLVVDREAGAWRDARFPDLVGILEPGDLLVVNETRVFPARLHARREEGEEVEVLLVRPLGADDPASADGREWEAMVRPGKRARPGARLALLDREGFPATDATAVVIDRTESGRRIRLDVPGDPWDWIEAHGHVPLPPYIERTDRPADRERYQTVYARRRGAVAAPTAGLHFTPGLLAELAERGVGRAAVVLHVGPGTFRPIAAERAEDHVMEAEWYRVPEETAAAIARTREAGRRVVAVGTTTVRALESAARADAPGRARVPPESPVAPASGWTDLFIRPGFEFQAVDALLTNFHLPRSTLLLLVSAFAGRELVMGAYRHAVDAGYRFYSYGDAMLVV